MQQLILLVLVAILVGAAILVGVRTSHETMYQVNEYEVAIEALAIVGYAQTWYRKPPQMGGGGGSFLNFNLAAINLDSIRVNGRCQVSQVQAESFRLTGIGVEGSPLHVTLMVFADSISGLKITH
jgi:hypothetical protein